MPRAQLLKKSAWLPHQIGDKAPPVARDSSGVARALHRRGHPHTGNGGPCYSDFPWRLPGPLPCGRFLLVPLTRH